MGRWLDEDAGIRMQAGRRRLAAGCRKRGQAEAVGGGGRGGARCGGWHEAVGGWGRLARGNKYGTVGTNTKDFIRKQEVPIGRDITYATFVCTHKPLKVETHHMRITVGGDQLSFLEDTGSLVANMIETSVSLTVPYLTQSIMHGSCVQILLIIFLRHL